MGWIALLIGIGAIAYSLRLTGWGRALVAAPGVVALLYGLALVTGLIAP